MANLASVFDAMGDFDDEPFNRSVLEELRASSGFDKLEEPVKRSGQSAHLPDVVSYTKLQAPLFNCMWPIAAVSDRGSYFYGSGMPTMNLLDQFIVSRGLYYGTSGLRMKRRSRLKPPEAPGQPPIEVELDTVLAEVFDPDLMITSQKTRRTKTFKFKVENNTVTNNDGFSDPFPIVTTIGVI